ncbi:MAG: aminopeptidase P N-terminal domain-containing protein, partial [Pirellulaceae bacterium]
MMSDVEMRHREFDQRRQSLAKQLEVGSCAVLPGRVHTGAFDIFRQNNEFYYLCGIVVPQAYLVIEAQTGVTTIYLPSRDEKMERSEGVSLNSDSVAEVQAATGIAQVRSYHALATELSGKGVIYCPQVPGEGRQICRDTVQHGRHVHLEDPWDGRASREEQFMANIVGAVPDAAIRDVVPLLDELRGCKSRHEIELMRIAGKLSAQAITEAMRCTVPGCWEYQLASVAEYVFRVNGADGSAYRPIVAGGENIWNAHYYRNHCQLAEGDLVLMDYAPDYQYYTSDIGRMWPVSGKYSPQQRELYGYIVNYHKTLLGLIRPGVMAEDVENEAAEIMRPIVEQTAWSQDSFCKGAEATLEFRGHLSHGVGMAVHDVWNYRQEPLRPGVVLALDPQMWIQEQEIYIRVEDTVVVTDDGVENLTADAPLELDHVE